jgi:hypothetical protein
VAKKVERMLLARTTKHRKQALSVGRTRMRELRGADSTIAPAKKFRP